MQEVWAYLFGDCEFALFSTLSFALLFFICLFSTTCFFFDIHTLHFFGYAVEFPVGLLFFPATYVISNILQDKQGRRVANTIVVTAFLADVVLVLMGWSLAHWGDRQDYLSVFNDLPLIMMASLLFIFISALFNTFLFDVFKTLRHRGRVGLLLSFVGSITLAECLATSLSMPLLFIKRDLSGSVLITIAAVVLYKLLFTLLASCAYVYWEACIPVTLTDCQQRDGLIYCAYALKVGQRRRNLPAVSQLRLPVRIIQSPQYVQFSADEQQLLQACAAFNHVVQSHQTHQPVKKMVLGDRLKILLCDGAVPLSFEFNERQFVGLMKKYRSAKEIRQMIVHLFERKE